MKPLALRLVIVAGLLLSSGCLLIPYPSPASRTSKVVTEDDAGFIEKGKTSREDVLLHLGAPSSTADNDAVFIYTGDYQEGGARILVVTLCGANASWQPYTRVTTRITFDGGGRVSDVSITRAPAPPPAQPGKRL